MNGLSDATTNEIRIRAWWTKWPDANVGIATGSPADIIVVDMDNKRGVNGSGNLAALSSSLGGIPETLTATTGCGEHLFFKHPGALVRNNTSKLAHGVDVRGDGGYVVAPPSMHVNGNRYTWKDQEQQLAAVPDWLLARIIAKREEMMTTPDIGEHNASTDTPMVNEGTRNDTLYKLGCALRGQHGKERDDILTVLLEYNAAKCNPPLEQPEVVAIAESVCQHAAELNTKRSGKRLEHSPLYWFPFNTREWFADQNLAIMTDVQTGWYIRLKAFAWDDGGFLPADHDRLWRLARAKSRKVFVRDCELVLAEYDLVEVNGEFRFKHPTMAARYLKTLEDWMKKKGAGDASKAARQARFEMQGLVETESANRTPLVP